MAIDISHFREAGEGAYKWNDGFRIGVRGRHGFSRRTGYGCGVLEVDAGHYPFLLLSAGGWTTRRTGAVGKARVLHWMHIYLPLSSRPFPDWWVLICRRYPKEPVIWYIISMVRHSPGFKTLSEYLLSITMSISHHLTSPLSWTSFLSTVALIWICSVVIYRRHLHPLAKVPGPSLAAVTHLYAFFFNNVGGSRYYAQIEKLHRRYGMSISWLCKLFSLAEFLARTHCPHHARRDPSCRLGELREDLLCGIQVLQGAQFLSCLWVQLSCLYHTE